MPEACRPGVPVELADGQIVMPDDPITLAALCELVPLLLETMAGSAVQGRNGAPTPGSAIPIAGGSIFMPSGAPPVPGQRPGAIVGSPSGPFSGGGGGSMGFGGGGGGRGASGARGPVGPPGPAGPGTILPVIKTDGNFSVASVSPFVPIPGTSKGFATTRDGASVFMIQAVFGGNSVTSLSNGQIGLRVDGKDFPLTANLLHTGAAGVDQFLASVHASFAVTLSAGAHTAELLVRGDSSLGAPTGSPVRVQANATIPLALTVIHQ